MVHLDFEMPVVELEAKLEDFRKQAISRSVDLSSSISAVRMEIEHKLDEIYSNLSPYQIVQVARHSSRPKLIDYVRFLTDDYITLHGDRRFADDKAMWASVGSMDGQTVFIIGQSRGRNAKENVENNFGMASPEGYRKAMRAMELAQKFNAPVITMLDTPGAYPGIGAEERGQAEAIAVNIRDMFGVSVPIITVIIGEGGSGGALGIGVGDRVLMMKNSMYSVISPEGCASILFRDGTRFRETSSMLKLTAPDLLSLGLVDEIIDEPVGGAHRSPIKAMKLVKKAIKKNLLLLNKLSEPITEYRYQKYKNLPPKL